MVGSCLVDLPKYGALVGSCLVDLPKYGALVGACLVDRQLGEKQAQHSPWVK